MPEYPTIRTTDMHTGGEPVRIVVDGYPPIPGDTILDKRRHAKQHLDHLRQMLMLEPRGHNDMYGVIPVEPDHPDADLAVLFCHNEGYSTMCGHATIALGRWAVDQGIVDRTDPETILQLQVPAGLLQVFVTEGQVRFQSVPSFVLAADRLVDVPRFGEIMLDVAYGGAFYAFVDASQFGLDVRTSSTAELVDAAWATTLAVKESVALHHPDADDLGFLYGTILTDGRDAWSDEPTANVCVFADRQVDRSPTGSGVSGRIAIQRSKGLIAAGQTRIFQSLTGAHFTGSSITETKVGEQTAYVVEVGGFAHYTGESTFTTEPGDDLVGFSLR